MWTHVSITGVNIDHQFASGIAAALGLTMQEEDCYALLDSNGDYYGAFYTEMPAIILYIDYNSEQESKYNALGGEDWLKNLLEKY